MSVERLKLIVSVAAVAAIGELSFAHDRVLYAIDNSSDELVIVDGETGATTVVAATGVPSLIGLDFDPNRGKLFGVIGSQLWSFDLDTRAIDLTAIQPGNPIASLALDPRTDTFYSIDIFADELLAIDLVTGTARSIGVLGAGFIPSLVFDERTGTLYGTNADDELLAIDTESAAVTTVLTGLPGVGGLEVDNRTGRLLVTTSTASGFPAQIFSVDPLTGVVGDTLVLDRGSIGDVAFVPAPMSGSLLLACVPIVCRRRRGATPTAKR